MFEKRKKSCYFNEITIKLFFIFAFTITISAFSFAQTAPNIKPAQVAPSAVKPNPLIPSVASATNNENRIWNLENADIRVVIDQVSKQTGKNFVIDPRVQGKINLISSTPLDPIELYTVFLKVLQTHGYAAIQAGKVIEIVPDNTARMLEIPTINDLTQNHAKPTAEGFVTKIIPVKYTPVSQLVPILRPLLPNQSSEISAYSSNNTLIISAEADKIIQVEKIIQELDQPSAANIQIVSLHYADATELVASLKSIMNSSGTRTDTSVNIAADKNSNSVLLSGPEIQRDSLKQVILRMDRLSANSAESNVTTAVVPLRYLQAKTFAVVLQRMVSGGGVSVIDSTASDTSKSTPSIPGIPSYATITNSSSSTNAVSDLSSSGNSKIQIQAEPQTNAILMSGPPAQIKAIKAVIANLDVEPKQVLVEAMMVEVSDTTVKSLGIEWGTLPPSGQLVTSASGVAAQNASSSLKPDFGAIVGGSGVGIVDMGRFKAVIRALATDGKTNILSTPSVVVLDNQEATVKVGKTVTDVTGSYITPGTSNTSNNSQTPFQTFAPKEIALHLTVTPQISPNQMIRMKIDQGNDTQLATSTNGNPDTSNSAIKTSVILQSGQVLVIGGLVSNDYEDNVQKVPLLGDIPVLGKLFQYKSDNLAKKNLLVFLRPIIITEKEAANLETRKKYNMMRELQLDRKTNEDILTPNNANLVMTRFPGPPLPQPF